MLSNMLLCMSRALNEDCIKKITLKLPVGLREVPTMIGVSQIILTLHKHASSPPQLKHKALHFEEECFWLKLNGFGTSAIQRLLAQQEER